VIDRGGFGIVWREKLLLHGRDAQGRVISKNFKLSNEQEEIPDLT